MMTGEELMLFGKHKGKPMSEVPTDYLDWLVGVDTINEEFRARVLVHLQTRADWQRMNQ